MKLALGGDHAGFEFKQKLLEKFAGTSIDTRDFGPFTGESVDYPDFVHPIAKAVENGECDFGILICGSGNGVAMTANKHQGIRAALCWNEDLATLARQHNDANILCLPARFVSYETAESLVDAFLGSSFEAGRHERRVDKINC